MNQLLTSKVVIVSGGAGLLGREFVKTIAQCGATAVIAEQNMDVAEAVRKQLMSSFQNGSVEAVAMDITDKSSVNDAIDILQKKYGRIDALVNSAYPRNSNYGRKMMDVEYQDFCQNLSMNLGGYFLTSQQFGRYFINQGHGNIVNIASIYGVMTPRFEVYNETEMTMPVEYAVIKSGLLHLTRYFAKYFKGHNIRVNALSPGGIKNDQPEAFLAAYKDHCLNKGMLDKSDMSGTLIYLLSDLSQFTNGQNIIVDDGFSL